MYNEHPDTIRQREQRERKDRRILSLFCEYLELCGIKHGKPAIEPYYRNSIIVYLNNDGWRRLFAQMEADEFKRFLPDSTGIDFWNHHYADTVQDVTERCRKGDMGPRRRIYDILWRNIGV